MQKDFVKQRHLSLFFYPSVRFDRGLSLLRTKTTDTYVKLKLASKQDPPCNLVHILRRITGGSRMMLFGAEYETMQGPASDSLKLLRDCSICEKLQHILF